MLGAIAGDMIGSVYEYEKVKGNDFDLFSAHSTFTDDTVLTVAVADCLLHGKSYDENYRHYFHMFPGRGYGGSFYNWATTPGSKPYNSWGNGSAMRVSPVGWARDTLKDVLEEAKRSAEVTHNHPEGIRGAQATAAAVFLARKKSSKQDIKEYIEKTFKYDLKPTLEDLRPGFGYDVSCQGTVPPALIAFLESTSYEDAVRKVISLGGDADTLGCITGSIAEAFYGKLPPEVEKQALLRLDTRLKAVVQEFRRKYIAL